MANDRPADPARTRPPGSIGDARAWLAGAALVGLVAATFAPAVGNGFVYDDTVNFTENPAYRGVGLEQIRWAWTTYLLLVYQPLSWMLLGAEYAAFGLDPRGYHLSSVALHAANALALFALTRRLIARASGGAAPVVGPALVAALFAAHPLRVEAVCWASCQPYLPCALFAMLAVIAYLKAHPADARPRGGWLAGSVVLLAASLLFKAPAIGVVGVFPVLDVYPLRRLGGGRGWLGAPSRRVWLEKVPFLLLGLAFAALAVRARNSEWTGPRRTDSASGRVARSAYATAFYVDKTFRPDRLRLFYLPPGPEAVFSPRYLPSEAFVLGTTAVALALRRRAPGFAAAWAAYLVALAPVSGFAQGFPGYVAADRYAYLPTLCWAAPAASSLEAVRRRGGFAGALVVAMLAACATVSLSEQSYRLCPVWRDESSLWGHAYARGGDGSATVCVNLGTVKARQGRLDDAEALFRRGAEVEPGNAVAHNNLGWVFRRRGRFDEAAAEYAEALRLKPGYPPAVRGLDLCRARRADVP